MNWRSRLWPSRSGGRTFEQLKEAAGSPYPYRLSTAMFWWSAGIAMRLSLAHAASLAVGLFAGIAFLSGGYFYVRIIRRRLIEALVPFGAPLGIRTRIVGWLSLGNPVRETTKGRAIFAFALLGFLFATVGFVLFP